MTPISIRNRPYFFERLNPKYCLFVPNQAHPCPISTELYPAAVLSTQPFLIRRSASFVILHSPLARLSPLAKNRFPLNTAIWVIIISFMSPTTFKPTLTTQSKDHISDKDNNEKTSILHKPKVDTITSPGQDKDRDARAYEHERKRTKHAAEWAKRRVRKMIGRPTGARAPNVGRQAKGGKAGLDSEVDDGYAVTLQGRDTEHSTAKISDGLGAGLLTKVFLPPSDDGRTDTFKADSGVKINLSEIMISQRKPRKPNGTFFTLFYCRPTKWMIAFFFPSSGRLRSDPTRSFCHCSRWRCQCTWYGGLGWTLGTYLCQ